jgi:heat shock protein HslJ
LALAGCGSLGVQNGSAGGPSGLNGQWTPIFPTFTAAEPRLTITGARAEGVGGCNRFGGLISRSGSDLRFEDLAATEMACAPDVMEEEAIFFEALERARSAALSGETLSLLDSGGATVLQFSPTRPPGVIAGIDWVLAAGAWNSQPPSLRIAESGREATGFTGCNAWFAAVEQTGERLRFFDIGMTKRACIGQAGAAERAFIAKLGQVTQFKLEGAVLRLFDGAGTELMRLSAQAGQ